MSICSFQGVYGYCVMLIFLSVSERNATGLFSQISAFVWVLEGDKINKVLTLKYILWCVVS